jgi:hypothetical protein
MTDKPPRRSLESAPQDLQSIASSNAMVQGATPVLLEGRTPRISKLMALALHFDRLVSSRQLTDWTEIARLTMVTQPRITQVMNLMHLSPDIQEELLFLPKVLKGDDPIHEKMLRPVCAEISFARQRSLWAELKVSRRGKEPG